MLFVCVIELSQFKRSTYLLGRGHWGQWMTGVRDIIYIKLQRPDGGHPHIYNHLT